MLVQRAPKKQVPLKNKNDLIKDRTLTKPKSLKLVLCLSLAVFMMVAMFLAILAFAFTIPMKEDIDGYAMFGTYIPLFQLLFN